MTKLEAIQRLCALKEKNRLEMSAISSESGRVAGIARNARAIIDNLDDEFSRATSLESKDFVFLLAATMLQCARWMIIEKVSHFGESADTNERLDHNDKSIKQEERQAREKFKNDHYQKGDEVKQGEYRDWLQFVFDAAPYDAIKGTEFAGTNHRLHTLGHDPLLGWVFGTMNFITTSLTTSSFLTYKVNMHPLQATKELLPITQVIKRCVESVKEDKLRLPAAVFAQSVHLASDKYTKMGLPIPMLSTFAPSLAGALYAEHYDSLCALRDLKTIGAQAFFSVLIDMIVGLIHGLYFDPSKCESRSLYEVKTRKILVYSKVIAESSNILQAAVRTCFGDPTAWKSLDFGGIGWTLIDIMRCAAFIREVKEEFIFGRFDKLIQGGQDDGTRRLL